MVREGQMLGVDDVVRLGFVREMRLEEKNRLSDRKSTRLNSSHSGESRMPSSA